MSPSPEVQHLLDFIKRSRHLHKNLEDTCLSYLRLFPARATALLAALIEPHLPK